MGKCEGKCESGIRWSGLIQKTTLFLRCLDGDMRRLQVVFGMVLFRGDSCIHPFQFAGS